MLFVAVNILSENHNFAQRGQTVRRLFPATLSTRHRMVLPSVVLFRIEGSNLIGEIEMKKSFLEGRGLRLLELIHTKRIRLWVSRNRKTRFGNRNTTRLTVEQ
jgi:hypothetical protein